MTAQTVLPISPSSPFDPEQVKRGLSFLQSMGLRILSESPRRDFALPYLNGSDHERLAELNQALQNRDADLLWLTRGGYGLTRILEGVEIPQTKTPMVVGYSDATALLFHLWAKARKKGIHAPTLAHMANEGPDGLSALSQLLEGKAGQVKWPALEKIHWPHKNTELSGILFCANLCVLTHLVGTSSLPSLEGSILVLEEIGERPYRLDRMLTQLHAANALLGVKAIVMGHFIGCEEPSDASLTAQRVLLEACQRWGIALCTGLPVGHKAPNWALPFGVQASLKASDSVQLQIAEELF